MPGHKLNSVDSFRHRLLLHALRLTLRVACAIAPSHVERWAVKQFLTPVRSGHRPAELALLDRGTRFDVPHEPCLLAAWSFGPQDAPVIVMSHGWSGRGAQFHCFVEPLLQAGFRVVLFDQIAHGFSGGTQAGFGDFALALRSVWRHLASSGAQLYGVVAHSMGCPSAIVAMAGSPVRPQRFVMISPPSSLIGYSREFAAYLGLSERVRQGLQQHIERRYEIDWRWLELPGFVEPFDIPALIIHDEDDRDVPVHHGQAFARHWRNAAYIQTCKLGHRHVLRDSDVIRDITGFLLGKSHFSRPNPASAVAQPAPLY